MLQRRRHVAEARRRAERKSTALVEVTQLYIGCAVNGHARHCGFDDGRHRRHGAQPCVRSIDLIDALRHGLGQ